MVGLAVLYTLGLAGAYLSDRTGTGTIFIVCVERECQHFDDSTYNKERSARTALDVEVKARRVWSRMLSSACVQAAADEQATDLKSSCVLLWIECESGGGSLAEHAQRPTETSVDAEEGVASFRSATCPPPPKKCVAPPALAILFCPSFSRSLCIVSRPLRRLQAAGQRPAEPTPGHLPSWGLPGQTLPESSPWLAETAMSTCCCPSRPCSWCFVPARHLLLSTPP